MSAQVPLEYVLLSVVFSVLLSAIAIAFSWSRARIRVLPQGPADGSDRVFSTAAVGPLREAEKGIHPADDTMTIWSPEKLQEVLKAELPDGDLIVVSNREPYIHERTSTGIKVKVPASGLVSALEPITRTCAGTWIAHGSGSADKDVVDAHDRIGVPPGKPDYTLRRVWLSEEEHKGYYSGFANEGLWPLCHIAFTRPIFRAADWECYQAVNRKFADIVVEEAKTDRPIVLIQDYHFALLPRLIREKLPNAIIITFWHIPWPNAEILSVCPWREQILDGLLGSSILGFHVQLHCNNFIDSADRFLESRIDREDGSITYGGLATSVHPYPISIEWPDEAKLEATATNARKKVFQELGLEPGMKLALGVERLDYTKGILDRFQALDEFFQHHSDWIGRVAFVQIAAPSRSALPAYQRLYEECMELVAEINARYGRDGYVPVIMLDEHHDQAQLFELYQAADVCVVSSLHDGMNLVAKEFVAVRADEGGVLVLSTFTGAARELGEALLVNPFDASAMGEAFFQALTMPAEEIAERMRRMRATVRNNNVYRWAGSMLIDAARIRNRTGVSSGAAAPPNGERMAEPRAA